MEGSEVSEGASRGIVEMVMCLIVLIRGSLCLWEASRAERTLWLVWLLAAGVWMYQYNATSDSYAPLGSGPLVGTNYVGAAPGQGRWQERNDELGRDEGQGRGLVCLG
jgi:hypothetical protein